MIQSVTSFTNISQHQTHTKYLSHMAHITIINTTKHCKKGIQNSQSHLRSRISRMKLLADDSELMYTVINYQCTFCGHILLQILQCLHNNAYVVSRPPLYSFINPKERRCSLLNRIWLYGGSLRNRPHTSASKHVSDVISKCDQSTS